MTAYIASRACEQFRTYIFFIYIIDYNVKSIIINIEDNVFLNKKKKVKSNNNNIIIKNGNEVLLYSLAEN